MRLSPKSIFVGVIALGLPFAVSVGWVLGGRQLAPSPPSVAAPGGAGSIGTAPARGVSDPKTGWLPGRYESRPGAPVPSAAASAPALASATTLPSASATTPIDPRGPMTMLPTLPPLTDPPVPTPTTVTSEPPLPSATPSSSATTEPSDGLGAGLLRRP